MSAGVEARPRRPRRAGTLAHAHVDRMPALGGGRRWPEWGRSCSGAHASDSCMLVYRPPPCAFGGALRGGMGAQYGEHGKVGALCMGVRRSSCRWRAARWRNLEWILTSSFLHHLFSVHSDRAELVDCWRNNHLPPTTRRCSPRHRRQSLLSRSLVVGFLSSDGCCGSMDTIWSSEDRMGSGPTLRRARPNRPPNGAHALALVGASMCPQTCRNGLALGDVGEAKLLAASIDVCDMVLPSAELAKR